MDTKRNSPELFAEAVEIDARIRGGLALDKTPYLQMLRMRPWPRPSHCTRGTCEPDGRQTAFETSVWDTALCDLTHSSSQRASAIWTAWYSCHRGKDMRVLLIVRDGLVDQPLVVRCVKEYVQSSFVIKLAKHQLSSLSFLVKAIYLH